MMENNSLPRFNSNNNLTVLTLDGKPVQVAHSVCVCLNFNFHGQRIGTHSSLRPLSSELRSLDLFLRVCVKDQVYSKKSQNVELTQSMGHCNKCEGYLGHITACLARDRMQTEVQMVLTVMCSASKNFSTYL